MRHGLLTILILAMTTPVIGDETVSREYQVKAAMIFNFAQFVEWPADAFQSSDSPLVIAVVGTNPFGDVLERLVEGKTISGRAVGVKYFTSADRIGPCHVLFVPASLNRELSRIMRAIEGQPVLSIGETEEFPWAGGIIRFYTEDNKVRFEINPEAAERARLKISSKLLKLARIFRQ